MHVDQSGAERGQDGGVFVLLPHVVGVGQHLDVRVRHLLRHPPALGDAVQDVRFPAIEMLDHDRNAVFLCDRPEFDEQRAELHPGRVMGEAGRHVARTGAAKDHDRHPQTRRPGERGPRVSEGGGEIGRRPGKTDLWRKEIVARLAGHAGAPQPGGEGRERRLGQRGEIAQRELDVVIAEHGELLHDVGAERIGR